MAQQPYIVGNWKMNGTRPMLAEARAIDRGAARRNNVVGGGVRVALAPPFTLVMAMAEALSEVAVGGQDCHPKASGAHTGDVSAAMLVDAGAQFVILGHSERRADHGESDALVRSKAQAAIETGLSIIVCVGETEAQRDAGDAESVVTAQLAGSLPDTLPEGASELTVAYEPVWAIGTGRVPSVQDVAAMHAAIRAALVARYGPRGSDLAILYGGSVNPGNAAELLAVPEVGGALVGGASLTADNFLAIVLAAAGPDED